MQQETFSSKIHIRGSAPRNARAARLVMPALINLPRGVGAKSGELGSILPSISPTYPISFCPWFRRLGDRETSRVIEKLEIRLSMGFAIIHPRILCHCVKLQTTPKAPISTGPVWAWRTTRNDATQCTFIRSNTTVLVDIYKNFGNLVHTIPFRKLV
jgi:hypothetical protein